MQSSPGWRPVRSQSCSQPPGGPARQSNETAMNSCIAVINAGSSRIKIALSGSEAPQPLLFRGQVEQIGVPPRLRVVNDTGGCVAEQQWAAESFDHRTATREIIRT